jgi:hypothetical protein
MAEYGSGLIASTAAGASAIIVPQDAGTYNTRYIRISVDCTKTFRIEQQRTIDGGSTWEVVRQASSGVMTAGGTYPNSTVSEFYYTTNKLDTLALERWVIVNTDGSLALTGKYSYNTETNPR